MKCPECHLNWKRGECSRWGYLWEIDLYQKVEKAKGLDEDGRKYLRKWLTTTMNS